jgi:predicted DCC family thiol-disulfide oxidoreductase YuxK
MIFDGDCGFCRFWINRWKRVTVGFVDYVPSQELSVRQRFPELPERLFDESVQLIEADGRVFSGAEAVFRSLSYSPGKKWPLRLYQKVPLFAALTESVYRLIARNRPLFSRLSRFLFREK